MACRNSTTAVRSGGRLETATDAEFLVRSHISALSPICGRGLGLFRHVASLPHAVTVVVGEPVPDKPAAVGSPGVDHLAHHRWRNPNLLADPTACAGAVTEVHLVLEGHHLFMIAPSSPAWGVCRRASC